MKGKTRAKKPEPRSLKPGLSVSMIFNVCLGSWLLALTSCDSDENFTPKPTAYFRIDFPEKKYKTYDTVCPFTFEYPVYAEVNADKERIAEPCWLNVDFPKFGGRIHLSYKNVNKNLSTYLNDTYELVSKHQVKASGIDNIVIENDTAKVYGVLYTIKGNAASSVQFFVTDSIHHFVRGALYFNTAPNGDSIAPVVDFIQKDVHHFLETFHWKGN